MPGTKNPFTSTRAAVDEDTANAQERNRLWWERMPMTYADWHADDRLPVDAEEFKQIETRVFAASPFLRQWFDRMDFQGQKVLDVGCGSGALSCRLAKMGARVTAIDITEAAVALARRNARAQGLDMDIVRMDAEDMALPPASFDFVFSWGVLHHTDDFEAAFREVSRVLKPGKSGLVMVYHRASAVYYLNGLKWLLVKGKLFRGHTLRSVQDFYTDGYYHRHFGKRELNKSLTAAGLEVTGFAITHMKKKMVPLVPVWLDEYLKRTVGWLLIAEFEKRPL